MKASYLLLSFSLVGWPGSGTAAVSVQPPSSLAGAPAPAPGPEGLQPSALPGSNSASQGVAFTASNDAANQTYGPFNPNAPFSIALFQVNGTTDTDPDGPTTIGFLQSVAYVLSPLCRAAVLISVNKPLNPANPISLTYTTNLYPVPPNLNLSIALADFQSHYGSQMNGALQQDGSCANCTSNLLSIRDGGNVTDKTNANLDTMPYSSLRAVPNITLASTVPGKFRLFLTFQLVGSAVVPFGVDKQNQLIETLTETINGGSDGRITAVKEGVLPSSTQGRRLQGLMQSEETSEEQHGRRLLQQGAGTPYANVTMTLLLPGFVNTTAQGLQQLRSYVPLGAQQIQGIIQAILTSAGYAVSASLLEGTISDSNGPLLYYADIPDPQAPSPAPAPAAHSNRAAIIGGVVGGVLGALLLSGLIGLAVWLCQRHRRSRSADKAPPIKSRKPVASGSSDHLREPSSKDYLCTSQKRSPDSHAAEHVWLDEALIKQSGSVSPMSTPVRRPESTTIYESSEEDLSPEAAAGVSRVLANIRMRQGLDSKGSRLSKAQQSAELVSYITSHIRPGAVFKDKYMISGHRHVGHLNVLVFGTSMAKQGQGVAMKFYCAEGPAVARFDRECAIYERFQEPYLKAEADNYLPRILDVYQSDSAVTGSAGDALPPCLVEEQGAYSLQDLLAGNLGPEQEACHSDRMTLMYSLAQAVDFLHAYNVIHRAIHPSSFVWFPSTCTWKLVGFGSSAASGNTAPLDYDLNYAPPELVQADHLGRSNTFARRASDMWSLGIICYEVLMGELPIAQGTTDDMKIAMLLGLRTLPWEKDLTFFNRFESFDLRMILCDLLRRRPELRRPAVGVLQDEYFADIALRLSMETRRLREHHS